MGSIELVAGLLLLLFALVPLLWKLLRARPVWIKLLVLIAWVAAYAGVSWAYSTFIEPAPPERAVTNRPQIEHRDGYVGSETCRSCHIHHHETWHDSYHRTMTQTASPTSVMGDFEDVRLELDGVDYNLTHEGEKFFVESSGKRSEIVMTTGSHHMQVYWFDSGEGREVGQLPFVYLLDQERWIPRTAAFLRDPRIPRSDEFGRWNKACLKCHSTHSSWRPDAELKNARTVVSEFGISCEACHGPGEKHVALNRNPLRRYALHLGEKRDPSIVQPQHIESGRSSQVCGQCHSTGEPNSPESFLQWRDDGYTYRPGENLFESRFVIRRHQTNRPAMIQGLIDDDRHFLDDHFWADGMVRVSGREYTGLLDSPCHEPGGLSCVSCHQLHQDKADPRPRREWANDQLRVSAIGNQACSQCHEGYSTDAEIRAHTHHQVGSSGSSCYNCHMPHTTYGLLKGIRSHTIASPSIRESTESGRPNACNLCHLDKTLDWSQKHLQERYGHAEIALSKQQQDTAASLLWLLTGDAGQRALIAWHMGWDEARATSGTEWMAPFLATLLDDPYDAVRIIAERTLRSLPGGLVKVDPSYDSMGPQEDRPTAAGAAIRSWVEWSQKNPRNWGPELLMRADGSADTSLIRALQLQRNNRRMYLAE